MTSGGKRQNAGRKRLGKETRCSMSVRLDRAAYEALHKKAALDGTSTGVILDGLILDALGSPEWAGVKEALKGPEPEEYMLEPIPPPDPEEVTAGEPAEELRLIPTDEELRKIVLPYQKRLAGSNRQYIYEKYGLETLKRMEELNLI